MERGTGANQRAWEARLAAHDEERRRSQREDPPRDSTVPDTRPRFKLPAKMPVQAQEAAMSRDNRARRGHGGTIVQWGRRAPLHQILGGPMDK